MSHLEKSIASFRETATNQAQKGIKKYGKPLDPLDDYNWLNIAKEEIVDGFEYLEAEQVKRQQIVCRIRKILTPSTLSRWTKNEINFLLDELEGK